MPWTDVPGRVKRKPAQRARRPAGGDHPPRSINERSRLARLDADAQRVRTVLNVLEQRFLRSFGVLDRRLRLDDDQLGIAVPGQTHRADAKLLVHRLLERVTVAMPRYRDLRTGPRHHLVEQLLDAVGQDRYLLLFPRDRNHPHTIDRLQVKRAFPRHANGPGDESARAVKEVELASHSAIQPIRRGCASQRTLIRPSSLYRAFSQLRLG